MRLTKNQIKNLKFDNVYDVDEFEKWYFIYFTVSNDEYYLAFLKNPAKPAFYMANRVRTVKAPINSCVFCGETEKHLCKPFDLQRKALIERLTNENNIRISWLFKEYSFDKIINR